MTTPTLRAALVQPDPEPVALQGGMSNVELSNLWCKKLPGIVPTERDMTVFAIGIEVGVEAAMKEKT